MARGHVKGTRRGEARHVTHIQLPIEAPRIVGRPIATVEVAYCEKDTTACCKSFARRYPQLTSGLNMGIMTRAIRIVLLPDIMTDKVADMHTCDLSLIHI